MSKARLLLVYPLMFVVSLYTTLVLTVLWGWFVTAAFHVPEIGFWAMYGLVLCVNLFRGSAGAEKMVHDDQRWEKVKIAIAALVPDDRRESVMEDLQDQESDVWTLAGSSIFGDIVGNTIALGIGFVVHILAAA